MPRLVCLLASLLLTASLTSSVHGADAPVTAKPKILALTEKNNGKKIALTKGSTFTITLDSNATTGYSWAIVRINPEQIALQGKPMYKAYPAAEGVVGSGGQIIYTFKAIEQGTCEMELIYRRPFALTEKPARKFTLTVEIKE